MFPDFRLIKCGLSFRFRILKELKKFWFLMFWTLLLYSNCFSILADIGYWYMEVCIMLTLPGRTFGTWRGAVGGTISYTYKITRRENVLLQWNHWHLNTLVTACLFIDLLGLKMFYYSFYEPSTKLCPKNKNETLVFIQQ